MAKDNYSVSYTKIKNVNKKWLVKQSLETGHTMSKVMDAYLDSIRTGKPVKLKPVKPKYIERAERVKTKKKQKMEALSKKAQDTIKNVKAKTRKPRKAKTTKAATETQPSA